MSKNNQYCCVLTKRFCFLFLSLLTAGIILNFIPTEIQCPIYYEWSDNLAKYWEYQYVQQNIGVHKNIYTGSVSCSKPLRASKVCSFIQKKRLQKNESVLDSPVPLLVSVSRYLQCSRFSRIFRNDLQI
ncbi:Hypothetical_protein [Hexamita inflata]|uniref:Hypothetical_protein n=1 Tax=Hexamita inflata TaxID=28002 RepID=A0AA86TYT8_9EUKA|nr:Hypothetical protein HINF_LOCUS13233 [Hexamita inflata]CAI9966732.1 Hypothetical protein HINF_LOCUS54377 [Hexamita inflata]